MREEIMYKANKKDSLIKAHSSIPALLFVTSIFDYPLIYMFFKKKYKLPSRRAAQMFSARQMKIYNLEPLPDIWIYNSDDFRSSGQDNKK